MYIMPNVFQLTTQLSCLVECRCILNYNKHKLILVRWGIYAFGLLCVTAHGTIGMW